jgi:hypothetical protein
MPNAEDFRRKIEEMEERYGITDCIYVQCTDEFSHHKLVELNELLKTRIIDCFLFDWGTMQRQLGLRWFRGSLSKDEGEAVCRQGGTTKEQKLEIRRPGKIERSNHQFV